MPLGSVRRNEIRRQLCRQQSILFFGSASEGWGCWGRPDEIAKDDVATTMAMPKILTVWRHVGDVIIVDMAVRVAMSTRMPSKGGGDEIWGSKPKKSEVS